jgi:uncharacterized membrane protein
MRGVTVAGQETARWVASGGGAVQPAAAREARAGARLASIDALRGLVMVFMLVDHVRETLFLHLQVADPVDARAVDPALFWTRFLSTFCAPTFVALTGLSAWLYGQGHGTRATSRFLLERGLFLMALEVTLVGFAWGASFPPRTFWLQVIWAIGVSMVALAALLHLPRWAQATLGLLVVGGHNLLDGVVLQPGHPLFAPWALLHQRAVVPLWEGAVAKTTYPVLAWVGVILLGYAAGPWFGRGVEARVRVRRLVGLGVGMLAAFVLLRWSNAYGDRPWFDAGDAGRTVMSFFSLTKYPPSLLFLLSTLGVGALLLALLERRGEGRLLAPLTVLGGAPMFFYLLHLSVLRALYLAALALYGPTKGQVYGVDSVSTVWLWVGLLLVPLWLPTRWFARLKQRRRDLRWLKYL